jgi:hypothetical protein
MDRVHLIVQDYGPGILHLCTLDLQFIPLSIVQNCNKNGVHHWKKQAGD